MICVLPRKLVANQEAERKGKDLKTVVRQLSDYLSSSKIARFAAETESDELAAKPAKKQSVMSSLRIW